MILSIWALGHGVGAFVGMAVEAMRGNVPSVKGENNGNDED